MNLRYWGAGYLWLFGIVCLGAAVSLEATPVRAFVGLLGLSTIGYGLSLARDARRQQAPAVDA